MAFNSVVIFAVAHVDGGSGRLRRVQLNFPIQVRTTDANSSAPGSIDIHNLESEPTHEPFQLSNGQYDYVNGATADLSFSMDRFLALDPADQQALAQSFANGSTLTLAVHVQGIVGTVQLPLQLRALKTSDFLFSGNSAAVAHHGSVTGANLTLPASDAIGNYSFTVAEDVDVSFNPVGYQTLVTYNAGSSPPGALTFPGAPPPLDTSNDDGFRVIIAHAPTSSVSVLRIDTHFPTETVVLIDRSGSMSSTAVAPYSKWDKALEAAHLFAKIYGTALPAAPSSGITDAYKIKLGSFAFVSSAYSSTYAPVSGFNVSTNPPVLAESSGGATPIGEALVEANGFFSSGEWRRRHLLLLTDGMDNLHSAGTPSLVEVRDDDPSVHVPSLYDYAPSGSTGDPNQGVVIHTFGYALSAEAPVFDLALLADKHGGLSLPSNPGSDPDVLDPDLLQAKFLDVLTTILPVERSLPTSGYTFNVEDGLERVIFIATAPYVPGTDPAFHASSATTGQASSSGAENTGNGFSWAWVDNPEAATDWTVSNVPSGAQVFALFDPALRMRCSVEASGLGQSIRLRARVTHGGAAVSGASIRVGVYRPGESMGELLTHFVQQGGLVRAIMRGTLDKRVLGGGLTPLLAARSSAFAVAPKSQTPTGVATVTAAQAAAGVGSPDTKSLRRILLEGAEHERNLAIQGATNSIVLSEVAPGRYEAELPGAMTQDEGPYNFHFRADGKTPNGHPFARNQWRSAVLAPIPDPETSEVAVSRSTVAGQTVWTATVLPRTATGRPIGPGMGTLVSFQYSEPNIRKELRAPVTLDNVDGTYSTRLELGKGEQRAPSMGLYYGPPGRKDLRPILIRETSSKAYQVKVQLNRIQVLDDKDPCIMGAGELAFDAVVAPNGTPNRAVRTRLPETGYYKLSSGQVVELNQLIYEGLVESEARLSVTVGGTEFDWLLFFQRKEKLGRYHRVVPLKRGIHQMRPDDEVKDPEAVGDWRLWYTVEVS